MEISVQSEEEMKSLAANLLKKAGERRKFAFYGEIGAGKTTLIQALCHWL